MDQRRSGGKNEEIPEVREFDGETVEEYSDGSRADRVAAAAIPIPGRLERSTNGGVILRYILLYKILGGNGAKLPISRGFFNQGVSYVATSQYSESCVWQFGLMSGIVGGGLQSFVGWV